MEAAVWVFSLNSNRSPFVWNWRCRSFAIFVNLWSSMAISIIATSEGRSMCPACGFCRDFKILMFAERFSFWTAGCVRSIIFPYPPLPIGLTTVWRTLQRSGSPWTSRSTIESAVLRSLAKQKTQSGMDLSINISINDMLNGVWE